MQSFDDYKNLVNAKNRLAELKVKKDAEQVSLKDCFTQKKLFQEFIELHEDAIKPSLECQKECLLKDVLRFTFDELEIVDLHDATLNELRLFTKEVIKYPHPNIVVFIDNYDYENGNEEGYSQFVLDNNLELLYNGELFVDVISSYKDDYHMPFDAVTMIDALEYYSEYDNFMNFNL